MKIPVAEPHSRTEAPWLQNFLAHVVLCVQVQLSGSLSCWRCDYDVSLQVAETYTAHHHKDKAATLHVVPEYEDNEDIPASNSGASDSNSTLPIPRARQAFIPRGSSDGDPPLAGASQQTHLQLPSPTASSALYGGLPKWGGAILRPLLCSLREVVAAEI